MAVVTAARRERLRYYRFDIRLVAIWNTWDREPVQTFANGQFTSTRRCTPAGFERFRETMRRNGFLLKNVRVLDDRRGAA